MKILKQKVMIMKHSTQDKKNKKRCDDDLIPKDVPKGHIVVYVGQGDDHHLKRHVISITLLNHPLFRALLDQARDEYDFTSTSKLCIPCEETTFLDVVERSSCYIPCTSMFRL